MVEQAVNNKSSYEQFYARGIGGRVFPTEFVVGNFLVNYSDLSARKPVHVDHTLDIAVGDGGNTVFPCDQGSQFSGVETTQGVFDRTTSRLTQLGYHAGLRAGTDSRIPVKDDSFDSLCLFHRFISVSRASGLRTI